MKNYSIRGTIIQKNRGGGVRSDSERNTHLLAANQRINHLRSTTENRQARQRGGRGKPVDSQSAGLLSKKASIP